MEFCPMKKRKIDENVEETENNEDNKMVAEPTEEKFREMMVLDEAIESENDLEGKFYVKKQTEVS